MENGVPPFYCPPRRVKDNEKKNSEKLYRHDMEDNRKDAQQYAAIIRLLYPSREFLARFKVNQGIMTKILARRDSWPDTSHISGGWKLS